MHVVAKVTLLVGKNGKGVHHRHCARKEVFPSSLEGKDWRVLVALATIVIECQHECTSLTITRLVRRCNEEQVNVEIRMVKPVAGATRLHPSDESRSLTIAVQTYPVVHLGTRFTWHC